MGTLAGWAYRKAITVNHTDDGAQTLYQMKLALIKGVSGTYGNTGGAITTDGDYKVHTFTTVGSAASFFACKAGNVEYLVIGGGGGGGLNGGGGGGAGGFRENNASDFAITVGNYTITVGDGGAGSTIGQDSIFSSITAKGGGQGGAYSANGAAGGSGGGGGASTGTGGARTASPVQGNNGGNGAGDGHGIGGGGGGAGAVGQNANVVHAKAGDGGVGLDSDILVAGSNVNYAGGGGGGAYYDTGDAIGAGGVRGGGDGGLGHAGGSSADYHGEPGLSNTGGGGGGGGGNNGPGGKGGSGIVIIRCLTANFLNANSPELVYLENHALNWPTDIQITASDGTTAVDFWREESDATDGTWWIECPSIAAGGTWTGYIYYGDADAADASSGADTFNTAEKRYSNFETGVDGDTIADPNTSWTEVVAHVHISTDHAYSGTRSVKSTQAGAIYPSATCPVAGGTGYAIRYRVWKTDAAADGFWVQHGNGTKQLAVMLTATEEIQYYDTGFRSTGKYVTADAWSLIEFRNINFAAGTYDIWCNDTLAKSGAGMNTSANYANVFYQVSTQLGNVYIDDVIVRNFSANEPTWAASGAEEALGASTLIRSVPRIARIMLMSH